jgi:glycosyltransferase involved in cell wall biosynthesis
VERAARPLANVRIVPWQPFRDLAPWLYAADVLLIPPSLAPLTRHGNTVLPLKLFQYLAAGRALVAPRAPDTAELLYDGVNAALVPAGDVAATVATLRRLAADPALAGRLAQEARRTSETLTWDRRAERIEAFLLGRLAAGPEPPEPDPWRPGPWLREVGRWGAGG